MCRRTTTIFLLLLVLGCSTAWGESIAPKMPGGKPLPDTVILDKSVGIPWVWVANKSYVPRELPGENQRQVSDAKPLSFLEPCSYAASLQLETGGTYLLLVRADETGRKVRKHLGWVHARHVIQEPHAIRNLGNHLYQKVMLVNTQEFIGNKADGKGKDFEHVRLQYGPFAAAESVKEPLRLSTIFFVYGDTDPRHPRDGYVLLGTDPTFVYDKTIEDPSLLSRIILGWVPKNRTCRWNTREALEWDSASTRPDAPRRRTQPGEVYATLDDALKGIRGGAATVFFREQFKDGVSQSLAYDVSRYPILDFDYEGHTVRKVVNGKNTLRRVGMAGGFIGKVGKDSKTLSLEQIEQFKRDMRSLKQQVELTEILFVIDDTEGMDACFPVVAKTVDRIIADIRKNPDRRVRFAVSYYNDTADGKVSDKAVKTSPLVDAISPAAATMIRELRDHQPRGGYDPREQVFHGIIRGIEAAHFHPNSRKIVIVLGDMADHADEKDPTHPGENKIVDHLVPPDGSPIDFYVLQVIDPDSRDDAKAFRQQMRTILDLYRGRLKDSKRGGYDTTAEEGKIRDHILERYNQLKRQVDELADKIARYGRGQWDTVMTPELEKMLERPLKKLGITLEELRKLDGFQVYQEGYAWQQSAAGIDQMRLCLLLSRGEIEDYLEVLSRLNKNLSVKDVLGAAVRTPAGELRDRSKFSDDEQLKKRGLEVNSWLLRKAIGEIPNEDTVKYLQELQRVRLKMKRLEDICKDRKYEYKPRTVNHPTGIQFTVWDRTGEPMPFQRGFKIGSDKKDVWYWIDVEEEWP